MGMERVLRLIAGLSVLASVALAVFHSLNWLVWTALVGLNLTQFAFSDWCPMVWFLERCGIERERD